MSSRAQSSCYNRQAPADQSGSATVPRTRPDVLIQLSVISGRRKHPGTQIHEDIYDTVVYDYAHILAFLALLNDSLDSTVVYEQCLIHSALYWSVGEEKDRMVLRREYVKLRLSRVMSEREACKQSRDLRHRKWV